MEIVAYILLLLVPVIAFMALFLVILLMKRVNNLKTLVTTLARNSARREDSDALGDFVISEM